MMKYISAVLVVLMTLGMSAVFAAEGDIRDPQICKGQNWAPDSRYQINGDSVFDIRTKLEWKRCQEGMRWNGQTCIGDGEGEGAYGDVIAKYPIDGKGWRLPNIDELATLRTGQGADYPKVIAGCSFPALNETVFPGDQSGGGYWSASGDATNAQSAWTVGFSNGEIISVPFDFSCCSVRLVRAATPYVADMLKSGKATRPSKKKK